MSGSAVLRRHLLSLFLLSQNPNVINPLVKKLPASTDTRKAGASPKPLCLFSPKTIHIDISNPRRIRSTLLGSTLWQLFPLLSSINLCHTMSSKHQKGPDLKRFMVRRQRNNIPATVVLFSSTSHFFMFGCVVIPTSAH